MSVIDSFVIELGLDTSKFTANQQQAFEAARKLENQQVSTAKNVEHGADRAGTAISGLKTQALSMLAVFTGGKGLVNFATDLTHADAKLGRLERNINVSASTINAWQGAARIFGGDAQSMAQSFTTVSDAFAGWKIGHVSPMIADLRAISTAGGKVIDINKGVEQSMLDLSENLTNINKKDPAQAGLLGRRLGLDPALYDLMIQGPDKLGQVLDYVRKIGVATKADTDAFGELEKRIGQMGVKAESLGRKMLGGKNGGAEQIMSTADFLNKPAGEAMSEAGADLKRRYEERGFFGAWYDMLTFQGGQKQAPARLFGDTTSTGPDGNTAWRNAIANIESRGSGGYGAVGIATRNGDRAYGKYQIMGNNIGPWSEAALGKRMTTQEFMASPEAQDKIFDHRFGQYVQKYGNPQDAASAWLTGQPLSGGANKRDGLGTSGAEYVRRFNAEGGGGGSPSSTQVHIETVNVTPPASADPNAWGNSFADAVKRSSFTAQANSR